MSTPNFGWQLPADGDSQATGKPWGAKIRDFMSDVDTNMKAALDSSSNAWTTAVQAQNAASQVQNLADSAKTIADQANKDLASMVSDNVLSPVEKSSAIRDYRNLVEEQASLEAQADAYDVEHVVYTTAINALQAYMQSLGLQLNVNDAEWSQTYTDVSGGILRAKFATAYSTKQDLLNQMVDVAKQRADNATTQATSASGVAAAAKTTAETAQANAETAKQTADAANSQLDRIASDSWLSRGEKNQVILNKQVIDQEYADIKAKAASLGVGSTAYQNAYTALGTYLSTLTPPWNDLTQDTEIDPAAFKGAFSTLYKERQLLLNNIATKAKEVADSAASIALSANNTANTAKTTADSAASTANMAKAVAETAQSDATKALGQLNEISADDKLTQSEKGIPIRDYNILVSEYEGLHAQAQSYLIDDTPYTTAVTALTTYLTSLTPRWDDITVVTPVAGSMFRQKFTDVYNTKQVLLNAIYTRAKQLADAANTTASDAQKAAASALTAAQSAQTASTQAMSQLNDIISDSCLTPDEKPTILLNYSVLTGEQSGIDAQANNYGITTEKTTYDNSVTALAEYLASLTDPVLWSDLGGNTTISGPYFRQKFQDVYSARQVLLNAIYGKAKSLLDSIGTKANDAWDKAVAAQTAANIAKTAADSATASAQAANTTLANLASDNVLTPGEKPAIIKEHAMLMNEQLGIDSQATSYGVTTEKTTYDTAVSALTTYLNGVDYPVKWNVLTGDTNIDGEVFRQKFLSVYDARQALLNAVYAKAKSSADQAQTTATLALTNANQARTAADQAQSTATTAANNAATALFKLSDIASDSILTPGEKPQVIKEWNVLSGEQSGIDTQATTYGRTTEKSAYDTAVSALSSYLGGLTSPVAWDNLSDNTNFDGPTFRTKFSNVYSARQTLLNSITNRAKELADAAQAAAGNAYNHATDALNAANNAQSTANSALSIANTAVNKVTNVSGGLPAASSYPGQFVYLIADAGGLTRGLYYSNGSSWSRENILASQIVDKLVAGQLSAGIITSDLLAAGGIYIGGGGGRPGVLTVTDGNGNAIGYIGGFSSSRLGGYGMWAKTLGIGGTKDDPVLYADANGNVTYRDAIDGSGNLLFKNLLSSTLSGPYLTDSGGNVVQVLNRLTPSDNPTDPYAHYMYFDYAYQGWDKSLPEGGIRARACAIHTKGNPVMITLSGCAEIYSPYAQLVTLYMRVVEIGDNGLPKVHPWNGVSCQAVYIPATQYARVTPTVNVQAKLAAGVHTFGVLWWIVGSSVTVETDYIVMDGSGVGGGLSLIELG